jgi:hypothetical protein
MPRAPASVASALADIAGAMGALRLGWYVFGAQALALRGVPRATADLDVTVLPGETSTEAVVSALVKRRFALKFGDPDFVARTSVLAMVHSPSAFPVDVVLGKPGLEEIFLEGSRQVRVGRKDIPVASATHLLVMKVLAARPKDLEDAATLLRLRSDDLDVGEAEQLVRAICDAIGEADAVVAFEKLKARAPRR